MRSFSPGPSLAILEHVHIAPISEIHPIHYISEIHPINYISEIHPIPYISEIYPLPSISEMHRHWRAANLLASGLVKSLHHAPRKTLEHTFTRLDKQHCPFHSNAHCPLPSIALFTVLPIVHCPGPYMPDHLPLSCTPTTCPGSPPPPLPALSS